MKRFLKENDLLGKDVIVAASNAGWIGHCFKDYETLIKGNIKGELDLLFSANEGERNKMIISENKIDKWLEQL